MSFVNLFFKLEKLKVEAYDDQERIGIPQKSLEVMFNPESIRKTYTNNYANLDHDNHSKSYVRQDVQSLQLKLVFDGTRVNKLGIEAGLSRSVSDRVQEFIRIAAHEEGAIHRPMYLKLRWGSSLNFNCVLTSLDINYSVFDRGGDPLRAELDVQFIADEIPIATVVEKNQQSPDLTHYRVVKVGDSLPLMCYKIYGSSKYYLHVAKANMLDDFRRLKPGQEIYFPPIKE